MKNNELFNPKIGDTVWYSDRNGLENLASGECVNIFEHRGSTVYVMASFIPDLDECVYEARDIFCISSGPKEPLNWLRTLQHPRLT